MVFTACEFFEFYNAYDKKTAPTSLTSIIFMLHILKKSYYLTFLRQFIHVTLYLMFLLKQLVLPHPYETYKTTFHTRHEISSYTRKAGPLMGIPHLKK